MTGDEYSLMSDGIKDFFWFLTEINKRDNISFTNYTAGQAIKKVITI